MAAAQNPRKKAAARTPATEVRAALIVAGRRILERDGEAALTVRAVAAEAGVAPMGVYNHFDGKVGLLNAVVTDGFTEFRAAIAADDTDAADRLASSGRNYRTFALTYPNLYALMFSTECDAEEEAAEGAFGALVEIVRYAQAAGMMRKGDAVRYAAQIWSAVHGAVALELAGAYPPFIDPVAVYDDVIAMVARGMS